MVKNYRDILDGILEHIGAKLSEKLTGEFIRITPTSTQQFRAIEEYLHEHQVASFGMQPKAERPKKILIRGLPRDTRINEIKNALSNLGYTVIRMAQLKRYVSKVPMPLFMVSVASDENSPQHLQH